MLVTKAHLAVRHAASKDKTRYNLNGVYFRGVTHEGEVAYPVTEATNGHMLLRITAAVSPDADFPAVAGLTLSAEDPTPFILPVDAADDLAARLKKKPRTTMPILADAVLDVPYTNANGKALFVLTDLETAQRVEARKIDGWWPNTDSVIPAKRQHVEGEGEEGEDARLVDDAPSFTVNLELLERVLKAAREADIAGPACAARFWVIDALSPLRIEMSGDGGELLAVVMPLRP